MKTCDGATCFSPSSRHWSLLSPLQLWAEKSLQIHFCPYRGIPETATPVTQVTEQQKVFLHFLHYWSKQTANFSSSETQQTPLRKQGSSEIKRGRVMKVRFMKKRLWVCEKCYRLPGFKVRFGVSLCFTVLSSYLYRNYFYTKYCRVNMVYVKQQSTLFFSTLKKVHFSP